MEVRLTFLCENYVLQGKGLIGEHGLSLLVEREGRYILFDTGQGLGLVPNARALGVDFSRVEGVVLSHGHYDHTGGLAELLHQTKGLKVTAHPDLFSPKYSRRHGGLRYIGVPYPKDALEGWGAELDLRREPMEVLPGVFTTGEVKERGRGDEDLLVKTEGGLEVDPLLDDLSLFAETKEGIVLMVGCAHAGLVEILRHVEDLSGRRTFAAVVGGMHLGFLPPERREEVIEELRGFDIRAFGVAHCTGLEAGLLMRERLRAEVHLCHVGFFLGV
ncbi:MAG: MBL fold metallo-hydrolase [Deltaproteobacteria bacterium]|nr:MAG: MBL fold metallo-hydrolase [Deltaproteobacteria bacterium]